MTPGSMLLSGWKIAYCADAQVFHTHTAWLQQTFGGASGEGFTLRHLGNALPDEIRP
ncbi:MAG: hypothetical protein PHD43_03300 [Methylococcales bacterium]|nr:hypothetical protein [Methylococcales bacterium]